MRQQVAERDARLAAGRTGVVAVAAGAGMARLFAELGADVVPGGETLNPSTSELLAGIHGVAAEEVLVLPSSSNVIMAADAPASCRRSRPGWSRPLAAGEPAGAGRVRPGGGRRERRAARGGASAIATGGVAPAARDDAQGRFKRGDAVGFADGEIVAWGGAGSTLLTTIELLADDAEIVTVIGGDGAPIPLEEVDAHVPDGVELEKHEGGQPSWWWLLAAQ